MKCAPASDSADQRIKISLKRACGPVLLSLLEDPNVCEVLLNCDGALWVDELSGGMRQVGTLPAAQAENIIKTVAGAHKIEITQESPFLSARFPLDGSSRFTAQLPPIVALPAFSIRKRAVMVFTLDQYVEAGIMTQAQKQAIVDAIKNHRNILVAGGTGSGKTTLLNAVIREMAALVPHERFSILEDTPEIQCTAPNRVLYETSPSVSMAKLVQINMRMRPDRILVGEVTGAEALALMESWNTGHEGGAATLHCNSAADAIPRLEILASKDPTAPRDIQGLIARCIDVVIYIEKDKTTGKRRVTDVAEFGGIVNGSIKFNSLTFEEIEA